MKLKELFEMAKRSDKQSFYQAAVKKYGREAVKSMPWADIAALAKELDVQIPGGIGKKVARGKFDITPEGTVDKKPAEKSIILTKQQLQSELPKNDDDIDWQVYNDGRSNNLNVMWGLTYRRNTATGAFREYRTKIEAANKVINKLEDKYAGYVVSDPVYVNKSYVEARDERQEQNGDDAYSEYEQSLGGRISFKVTK